MRFEWPSCSLCGATVSIAVSYTHLDVYKRQGPAEVSELAAEFAGDGWDPKLQQFIAAIEKTCLLYTSRCV